MTTVHRLRHGDVGLELAVLRARPGRPLLLLHSLHASSADWPREVDAWAGSVFALDFSGHGRSDWRRGGAYQPELLAADADVALDAIARDDAADGVAIAGAGVGAWVALLVSGARRARVTATLLLPGPGLDGGGPLPVAGRATPVPADLPSQPREGCDPMVITCESDPRPSDYALAFGMEARALVLLEDGTSRPPWWVALRRLPGARSVSGDRVDAFATLARLASAPRSG